VEHYYTSCHWLSLANSVCTYCMCLWDIIIMLLSLSVVVIVESVGLVDDQLGVIAVCSSMYVA
jgi:uncharacterized membrane protein